MVRKKHLTKRADRATQREDSIGHKSVLKEGFEGESRTCFGVEDGEGEKPRRTLLELG